MPLIIKFAVILFCLWTIVLLVLLCFEATTHLSLEKNFNKLLLYECSMLRVEMHHLFMSGTLSGSNCLAPFPPLLIVASLCW